MNNNQQYQGQNNVQSSPKKKNKIMITVTAVVIILCVAAAAIIISKVPSNKFKNYAVGNAFVHYALIESNIHDCYRQSGDEELAVSEGLQLYYDANPENNQWSDIQFNAEHTIVTHAVLTGDATFAAENGLISEKFKGINYRVTIDVPQEVYENKTYGDISRDDVNFTFEKLN